MDTPNQNSDNIRQITASGLLDLTSSEKKKYLDLITTSSAGGKFFNQYQTFFTGIDRFQHNLLPPNVEHSGLTFITRPRLCFATGSLRTQSEFAPLDTDQHQSIPYMIRCLLDTRYCRDKYIEASKCLLLNINSPFLTPVQNALQGISGFPDPVIQTLTTDAGFHSEDQTFVTGYDQLNKSYDLSLTFKDIQNGPIAAIMYYWMLYMGYAAKGMMPAYMDDIEYQRMNYTVSIYRFVLDPTRKTIVKYSKATGCFPKSVPLGAMFNFSETEICNSDSGKFTIPFAANKIEYNKYQILVDFNTLVNRYRGGKKLSYNKSYIAESKKSDPNLNYVGTPWIDTTSGSLRLLFL